MFASSAIALLLIGAVAADHEGNVVTLGSAMDFSVPTGSSTCPIKLSVPASVVGADCRLRIRYDIPEGDPRTPTISFFLKKGGVGTFTDADKVVVTDRQYEGPCEAGEFYFGAKVESCTACVLGANAPFYISHTIIKNGTAVIDMGTKTEFYTSRIFAKADSYIVHTFETTAAMQTAHWKILKCSLCAFDTYKYYQAPASASIADATVAANEVTSTSSASLDRRIEYQIPAAGKYQFIIKLGSAGTNTYVISQFKLGGEPDKVELPEAKCPKKDCAADDLKSCKPCNDNGCNWCAGSQKQCVPGVCAVEADLKDEASECPDVDMECRSIKTNCKDCVTKGGCIWCDTGATFGFSSGVCTAGVDGLAKTCNTVGSAIKVTQMSTTLTECPGGNAASLVMSAVALLVAAVAMI